MLKIDTHYNAGNLYDTVYYIVLEINTHYNAGKEKIKKQTIIIIICAIYWRDNTVEIVL